MLFYGKTVVKFRVMTFGLLQLSLIVDTPAHHTNELSLFLDSFCIH